MIYRAVLGMMFIGVLSSCKSDPAPTKAEESENEPKTFQVYQKRTPHWAKNTTIAHVDLRDPSVSLASVTNNLEEWQRLGITALILSPVYAKDEYGQVVDFTKVDPEVGTFEELQEFIRTVRRRRMRTILEWTLPTASTDHVWRNSNPDWFIDEGKDQVFLNLSQANLRSTLIESMKFWLRSADIDGFSCVGSSDVSDAFWQEVRPALESIRPVLMLADSDGNVRHHEFCFEATKATSFDEVMDEVINGKKTVQDFQEFYNRELARNPSTYFTYHSIDPVAGKTDQDKLKMSLAFLMDGVTVLNNQRALKEDPVFYQRLIMLRNYNRGLSHGADGGRMKFVLDHPRILAFRRSHEGQMVIVVANCSAKKEHFTLQESLRTMADLFTGENVQLMQDQEISLAPWQIHVLANPSIQI